MKKIWSSISVVLLMAAACCMTVNMTGCGDGNAADLIKKNKEKILVILEKAAQAGSEFGLKKWAEKDPAAAKEAAAALAKNLKEEILPYLNGEDLHTSAEVNEFINSSLFKKVPSEVKAAIVTAAAVLDLYLPIPGSDKLTEDQRDYLKAFLGGIQKAAAKFESGTFSADQRHWIVGPKETASLDHKWING
jgi:hypothetical protein